MAGSEKSGSGSSVRWILQGAVVGIVAALIVFGVVAYLRGPQEHRVEGVYRFPTSEDEVHDFEPNRLNHVTLWDMRQSSLLPWSAGLGGDGFVSMRLSISAGHRDSEEWLRFRDLGIELYPVDADGIRGEALVPEPESRRRLDELSGQQQGGISFVMEELLFEPPATPAESYLLVLTLDGAENGFAIWRRLP